MADQGSEMRKLVVASVEHITLLTFDGTRFTVTGQYAQANFVPASVLFKKPNLLYVSEEASDRLSVFRLGPDFSDANSVRPDVPAGGSLTKLFFDKPTLVFRIKGTHGSSKLAFNADKTRILQTCQPSGTIDVWDCSAADGSMRLLKRILNVQRILPWHVALDPTGRYFLVMTRGGDTFIVIDTNNDRYEITNVIKLVVGSPQMGHFAFLRSGETSYVAMMREPSVDLFVFAILYEDNTINLIQVAHQNTGDVFDNSASSPRIEVAANQRDIYASVDEVGSLIENTSYIAHFTFENEEGNAHIDHLSEVTTGGNEPHTFQLSADTEQRFLFVGNWEGYLPGQYSIVVLRRDPRTGELDPTPAATMTYTEFGNLWGGFIILEI
ncbi:hypothetical protein Hte_010948 [Hypoxylon texense]